MSNETGPIPRRCHGPHCTVHLHPWTSVDEFFCSERCQAAWHRKANGTRDLQDVLDQLSVSFTVPEQHIRELRRSLESIQWFDGRE